MSELTRSVIRISGEDALHFLQGILTQDVTKLADEKIQFAALLSPQGKILHDMFLVRDGDGILIDTPARYTDILLKRLAMYKLRANVSIAAEDMIVGYSTTHGFDDPRHAELPKRIYGAAGDIPDAEYRAACIRLGIPDSAIDFAPDTVVAMDAGYDLLHAISFSKGCYVGQEVTARMHYKNIARKAFHIIHGEKLVLMKFDDAAKDPHAVLPAWLQPKLAQHHANTEQNA